ncbi:MAG TPA: DMT family transporter [Ktedonobacteraceae bacterium]|nr:DMT family transporter [Ktedonobacteraceae bacterium]
MGILLGLAAALCWGLADFFARSITQIIGTYRTVFYMQFTGLAGLTIYMAFTGDLTHLGHGTTWQAWMWALVVAGLSTLNSLALYRAFEIGVLTIVSPIVASYAALTVLLSFLSGETISQARGIGIGAAIVGVVLAATSFAPPEQTKTETAEMGARGTLRKGKPSRGVGWALVASLGFGIIFWIWGFQVTPVLGGIVPVWIIRIVEPGLLALCAIPARQSLRFPPKQVWGLLLLMGIVDTLGYITFAIGLTTDQVAIVSVLGSLFSAVTVMLAWLFLHEKLHWSQWLGISIIFIGVVFVKL